MPERMVAIVIAVADAKPLPFLPAALNGARDFGNWASALGYETTIITDEDDLVTVPRLTTTIEALLKTSLARPIDRLVLYFAGHGLIQEAEEGLWLVSDWSSAARAVRVELLKRRLFSYHVRQIAIFSDSCRLLPLGYRTAELTQDGVIGFGPKSRGADEPKPPVDSFIAAQDYSAAFSVPGSTEQEDRCIFTGVLLPGLWGTRPEAFSKDDATKVVSRSLAAFLQDEVKTVASMYKLKLAPSVVPTFPENEDVYFLKGRSGSSAPVFPPWPPASSILPRGPEWNVDRGASEKANIPYGPHGSPGFGIDAENAVRPRLPRDASMDASAALSVLSSLRETGVREFPPGCGFAIAGCAVRTLWTPSKVEADPLGNSSRWQIRSSSEPSLKEVSPVLIEFKDGRFGALAALPNHFTSIVCDDRGVFGLVYHNREVSPFSLLTEAAISRLESGPLRYADAIDFAVEMRKFKHSDPTLGVISAYLYDSIGDRDSIRAMAYYYTFHKQSIPYDIALLAQLRGTFDGSTLRVDVPPVPKRTPRTRAEGQQTWTQEETPAVKNAIVGGLWPWMRQGWPFLDDPSDDGSTLILPGLRELVSSLEPARFATMNEEGGRRLIGMFGLVDRTLV